MYYRLSYVGCNLSLIIRFLGMAIHTFASMAGEEIRDVATRGMARFTGPAHPVLHRRPGVFVEKLRIDPATPLKGPNYSHYHINNTKNIIRI